MAPRVRRSVRQKAIDKRVEQAFYRTCSGRQIPVMKMTEIFKVGRESVAAGDDDETLGQKIRAFVDTLKV